MGRHSRSFHTFRYRQLILVFVATYTRNSFSRHTGQPATHPLNGTSFWIQRLQWDRGIGRNLKYRRTVFFYRNGTQQTLDIPTTLNTLRPMVGRSSVISIFISKHTECFYCTTGHTFQAFTLVYILNEYGSLFTGQINLFRNHRRYRTLHNRSRANKTFPFKFGNQREVIVYVNQIDSPQGTFIQLSSNQEIFIRQWIRLDKLRPYAIHQTVFYNRFYLTVTERQFL